MPAYELLYSLRAAAEARIVECDAWIARRPNDIDAIWRRQRFALVAARFHARIERLERNYECL
jgi:hypothetical protein